jgi:hypothetical protein
VKDVSEKNYIHLRGFKNLNCFFFEVERLCERGIRQGASKNRILFLRPDFAFKLIFRNCLLNRFTHFACQNKLKIF